MSAVERYRDGLDDGDLLDFIEAEEFDCAGCVLYRSEAHPDIWLLQSEEPPWIPWWPRLVQKAGTDQEYAQLIVIDKDVGLSYVLAFHDDEVIEAMVERFIETWQDQ